jgi:hypothetical protein
MTPADFIWGSIGTVTVILPGWFVARAGKLPQPLLAGFVGGPCKSTSWHSPCVHVPGGKSLN